MKTNSNRRHRYAYLVGISCLLLAGEGAAANKCVRADGSVSFQDGPCPVGQSSESLRLRENTVGNGVGRREAPQRLKFGANADANFVTAKAAVEVLVAKGRECKIEIRVQPGTEPTLDVCNAFVSMYDAWWVSCQQQLLKLTQDRKWFEENVTATEESVRGLREAQAASAFVRLYLRSAR